MKRISRKNVGIVFSILGVLIISVFAFGGNVLDTITGAAILGNSSDGGIIVTGDEVRDFVEELINEGVLEDDVRELPFEELIEEVFGGGSSSGSGSRGSGSSGGSSGGGSSGGSGNTGGTGNVNPPANLSNETFVIPPEWIPVFDNFRRGVSTNWSAVSNISNVCTPIIDIPGVARIRWKGCVDARGANFDRDLDLSGNFLDLNSSSMHPSFNSPAEVTFVGLNYSSTPVVYRNGVLCLDPECVVRGYDNGDLLFDVRGFSSYTAGPNSGLRIWDETEGDGSPFSGQIRNPGETTRFFANYTNITSGSAIVGASCFINFTDSSASMSYNGSSGLYQYDRTFSSEGLFDFNVTCSTAGFEELNTDDFVDIHNDFVFQGPNGASLIQESTSRTSPDSASSNDAIAGNMTEILITGNSITQSWQGYVGNVSGTISLENIEGSVFYNWSNTNPQGEVYASRTSGVDFSSIECANNTEILAEEVFLGQETTDVDSVSNTFNLNSHPEFFVGPTQVSANTCNSTNLFTNTGQDSGEFYEVLLADSVSRMVYTAILEDDEVGYSGNLYDFEMIVGEDGHGSDLSSTTYYFYLEIN